MSTTLKITKEMILDTAFSIVQTSGIEKVSNREIAKRLNCSIRPIYYQFKNTKELNDELKRIINNKPKMINNSNQNENVYISQDLEQVLNDAEKNANQMKDEYISVEHIMLGFFNKPNRTIKELFD